MRIMSWNLEKRDLIGWAQQTFSPDVLLAQEFVERDLSQTAGSFIATSFMKGRQRVGTAVIVTNTHDYPLTLTRTISCADEDWRLQFWKGGIRKATAIATFGALTVVSFHGYNGWPQHDPLKLHRHVQDVLLALPSGPCLFAGDFNTFTQEHHDLIKRVMSEHGFELCVSVPYDAKKTLDLVYARGCAGVELMKAGHHMSDHPYMLLDVKLP